MREFLYQDGWGAFAVTLLFFVPFLIAFAYVVYRKGFAQPTPSNADPSAFSRAETIWIAVVLILFVGINVASIGYMPTVATARAASAAPGAVQQVDLTARSWSYQISNKTIEAGRPVRFSGRSADTMHGFAVYHPDGRVMFTMMLMPGLTKPTSLVHTFTDPGKYKIRCLEYCGIAHHAMQDELVVEKRKS